MSSSSISGRKNGTTLIGSLRGNRLPDRGKLMSRLVEQLRVGGAQPIDDDRLVEVAADPLGGTVSEPRAQLGVLEQPDDVRRGRIEIADGGEEAGLARADELAVSL